MKRMRLLPIASRNAMFVWPHRPKITSTPSRSRYSVSRYEAMRVSLASARGAVVEATVIMTVLSEDFRFIELAEQLLLRGTIFGERPADPRHVHVVLQRDVLV